LIPTIVLLLQIKVLTVMSLVLTGIGLAASAIGTGINAYKNAQANKLAEQGYNRQRDQLLTDMYTNPLDLVGNKAILSQMDRRLNKQEEAIANQAAAGGATFENTLAAKQAGNEAMADVVSGIMQAETARQDAYRNQLLNLDSQRTAQQIAAKQQAGQNWASMGNDVFNSFNTLGGTMMENGIKLGDLFKFKSNTNNG
jgi:hypothetical protein